MDEIRIRCSFQDWMGGARGSWRASTPAASHLARRDARWDGEAVRADPGGARLLIARIAAVLAGKLSTVMSAPRRIAEMQRRQSLGRVCEAAVAALRDAGAPTAAHLGEEPP